MLPSPLFKDKALINGEWIDSTSYIEVVNPATGQLIGTVPKLGTTETKMAINAAYEAQNAWSSLTAQNRAKLLKSWHRLIIHDKENLARIMTLEQGKNIKEALGEIEYAASFIDWFAEQGKRVYGELVPQVRNNQRIMVMKQPIGVVGAITPWNFPAAMITRKISPALAAGCTIVLKPSEQTPFTALALAHLSVESGIPPGVINVITGNADEIGRELCHNFKVRKISFTGSTAVGKHLATQSAPDLKRLSLELGGNAPCIIFDDANLEQALEGVIYAKFRNNGQACTSINRLYLASSIKDIFIEKLKNKLGTLKIGEGLDVSADLGPLINQKAIDKIGDLLNNATQQGAKILHGGKKLGQDGCFFEPTIITDVNETMEISNNEIFGPVIAIYEFKEINEVIKRANATEYGLAAYVYTNDYRKLWYVGEQLEYGMIGFNDTAISNEVAPFGGIKHSGYGREAGHQAIEEYLQTKYISVII